MNGTPPDTEGSLDRMNTAPPIGQPALRLTINEADPAYVDERAGGVLYVYLRGVEGAVRFRRSSLDRAVGLYERAAEEPSSARAGLGLLVLQRTHFVCEDLGALLFALAGGPHGERLTSYRFISGEHALADESGRIDTTGASRPLELTGTRFSTRRGRRPSARRDRLRDLPA